MCNKLRSILNYKTIYYVINAKFKFVTQMIKTNNLFPNNLTINRLCNFTST